MSSASSGRRLPKKRSLSGGVRPTTSTTDPAYDRWLDKTLHEIYDPVLHEPIPDEIAKLLDQFEDRPDDQPSEE